MHHGGGHASRRRRLRAAELTRIAASRRILDCGQAEGRIASWRLDRGDLIRDRMSVLGADRYDWFWANCARSAMRSAVVDCGPLCATQSNYVPPVTVEERAWFNPNLEDRWFFIPGIMANVLFSIACNAGRSVARLRAIRLSDTRRSARRSRTPIRAAASRRRASGSRPRHEKPLRVPPKRRTGRRSGR